MPETLRHVPANAVITGWDFSTSGVKCLAFNLDGETLAEIRLPTDLWTEGGVKELNLLQLEGQAHASVRAMAAKLRGLGLLDQWLAGGISATHHTSGRIDADHVQVRRAICWNDETLAKYHGRGLKRLGGQEKVRELVGGPWAIRYSLSHLVKDEAHLDVKDWRRTTRILSHGSLAAGYLTDNFEGTSVSCAASTGIMDLRTNKWCEAMLDCLEQPEHRQLAWQELPRIIEDMNEPIGYLSASLASAAKIGKPPLIFPTSDDQQAGLAGGGAVEPGQVAIVLGTSAVVNSSAQNIPEDDQLDVMRLNWGPYLWMRCYNNGAGFLNHIVGADPDWAKLEADARAGAPGGGGLVLPFIYPEPSLGIHRKTIEWDGDAPKKAGKKFRAALEALAYLIALGVRQHEASGQTITRLSVSGGIANNRLMCEILATVLGRPIDLLQSFEGSALGAAVTALAGLENHRRKAAGEAADYTMADAVARFVRTKESVSPNSAWQPAYEKGLAKFTKMVQRKARKKK